MNKSTGGSKYSPEEFENDLKHLGTMIGGFYKQHGGANNMAQNRANKPVNKPMNKPANKAHNKPMNKPANKPMNKPANKPMNKANHKPINKANNKPANNKPANKKANAKPKNKVAKSQSNDRHYSVSEVNGKTYAFSSRYSGSEPLDAAKKAFSKICAKLSMNKACTIEFSLVETTRGSDKKVYGPYRGYFEKRATPRVVSFKGKTLTITHDKVVKLIKE
jgi:hypothetical protein